MVTAEEALRHALSLPVVTTVSGIDSMAVLEQNLATAAGFEPMTLKEMQTLRTRVAREAAVGRYELYTTSLRFDADEGRKQHGYPATQDLPL